ncbi:isochorismatase family protein [Salinicoccus sp. YB14-2]|uniref:isochorismatase family protein n=1 Tax=Salinicoccus sp. YB14-2 TaxID=1572701 RepID=UPI00068C0DED|nr:isochorismatase family protein [Salinicoccus sp. YB14-2]
MKALLIIDVQKGFLDENDYDPSYEVVDSVVKVANIFKKNNDKVIAFRHIDDDPNSPIAPGTPAADIPEAILEFADEVIEKRYPISFKGTNLDEVLKENGIEEIYISGFNMEFCILFTSIAAADRGYDVTVIEDLCNTVNNGETYGMGEMNIVDFVGTVIDRSDVIKNKYLEETEFNIKK